MYIAVKRYHGNTEVEQVAQVVTPVRPHQVSTEAEVTNIHRKTI